MLAPWEVLDARVAAGDCRRCADDLRGHRHPAVEGGGGAAGAAVLDRTAGVGDAAAGLERGRPGRSAAAFDARAYRVPDHDAPARARRGRPRRRWAASARAGTASRRCGASTPSDGQQLELGCAATRRSAASRTSTAWAAVAGHHGHADARPPVQIAANPSRTADTLNLRCSSATTGRITERFSLSDRTSPSNTSNSSQPIHI